MPIQPERLNVVLIDFTVTASFAQHNVNRDIGPTSNHLIPLDDFHVQVRPPGEIPPGNKKPTPQKGVAIGVPGKRGNQQKDR